MPLSGTEKPVCNLCLAVSLEPIMVSVVFYRNGPTAPQTEPLDAIEAGLRPDFTGAVRNLVTSQ